MKSELSLMALPVGRWASYLKLAEGEAYRTVLLHPNLLIDVDSCGNVLGIETMGPINFDDSDLKRLEEIGVEIER